MISCTAGVTDLFAIEIDFLGTDYCQGLKEEETFIRLTMEEFTICSSTNYEKVKVEKQSKYVFACTKKKWTTRYRVKYT